MTSHRTAVRERRSTTPAPELRTGTPTPRTGPDGPAPGARSVGEADTMAVLSFVSGLVGLLVMNLVLGPVAIALGALALIRGTTRPARARLGLALGVADLVVLACLIGADHTWSWSLG
ncbi:DUF4190 domain-containing protein [Streptomyces sp. NPDC059917]|uniref:DUF4190 domain-containing protein n=1 Tax=Streptomyces sp. NPDC059917 TaxID=3347002 RepID=UPI0036489131